MSIDSRRVETIDEFLDQFPTVEREQAIGALEEMNAAAFEKLRETVA